MKLLSLRNAILFVSALALAACAADSDMETDQPFSEGAEGISSSTCPRPVNVVIYTEDGTDNIADALHADQSPCARYWVSLPALATDKTQPRGPAPVERMHARGANFHALAEFHWGGWRAWVEAASGRTWFEAGVEFRRRMVAAGYDVNAGDTWAINELPSTLFEAGDPNQVRVHAMEAVRGLFEGPAGAPQVKGVVFSIGRGPDYKSGLETLLTDSNFWDAMEAHVRFWAPEVYTIPSTVCVPGTTVAERSAHINEYIEHLPRLAMAGPDSVAAARNFLRHAFVPLMNGVWGADVYHTAGLTLRQMEDHVSTQTYAARSWAAHHEYPGGRLGFSWAYHSDVVPAAQLDELAARMASSIHGAYGAGGGAAVDACSPSGAYTNCQCEISGASWDQRWESFTSW